VDIGRLFSSYLGLLYSWRYSGQKVSLFAVTVTYTFRALTTGYYRTDHLLWTVQATSENTLVQGLEIAAHCDY